MSIDRALCSAILIASVVLGSAGMLGAHPGIHEQQQNAEAALKASPGDPDKHISLGQVHAQKEEWDAALAAYAQARRLGAAQDRISILEGVVYLKAAWPRMAREKFEGVLRVTPGNPEALLGRARVWTKLNESERAAQDYAAAVVTIQPLEPNHVLEYKDALQAAGRPSSDVLAALDLGLKRLGQIPVLQLTAIDLEIEAEQYDGALRRLDVLLETSPNHPVWTTQRAEILEQAGRNEEARLTYVDALASLRARNVGGRARRLTELEGRVRAALARQTPPKEVAP